MTTAISPEQREREEQAVAPTRRPWAVPTVFAGLGALAVLLAVMGADWPVAEPRGLVLGGTAGWVVAALGAVVVLALIGLGFAGRSRWHYPEGEERDLRVDWVRGLVITFVVLNQINFPSLFQLVSQEAVGPVSGAELFVALSGFVVGMVYRARLRRMDMVSATGALWARAFKLYKTALVVVITVFLLTLLPGVDGRVVTTYTDQSTGQSYGLYPNMERLLDYPVPGFVLRDILLLRVGPYQFNIMGLYVVLLVVSPLLVAALRKRLVLLMLAVSWTLSVASSAPAGGLLGARFEDPFPLLIWQLLFVHGLAAGWYRTELHRQARRWWGRTLLAAALLGAVALAFFSANNPNLSNGYDARLALLPDASFLSAYEQWFQRDPLGLGRVLDTGLVLLACYALLTAFWVPLNRALGWYLVPMGQASLYVFVLHVFFALAVANVPGLGGDNLLLNTVVHALVLGLLWLMVRRRFLFSIVPR